MSARPARPYHVRLFNSADPGGYVDVFGAGSRGTDGERQGDGAPGQSQCWAPSPALRGSVRRPSTLLSQASNATVQALPPSPSRKPGWLEATMAKEQVGEGVHFHSQSRKEQTSQPLLSEELTLAMIVPCGGKVGGGLLSGERPGPRVAAVLSEQRTVPLPIIVSPVACAPGEQLQLGKTGCLWLPRDVFAWLNLRLRHSGVRGRCRHVPQAWPVGQQALCRAYTLHLSSPCLPAPLRGHGV